MRRKIIAAMVAGMLGGFALVGPMPRASAQVSNQWTIAFGPTVQGVVTQKFTANRSDYYIAVNGQPYNVPIDFYDEVNVGTIVQFDGTNWRIIGPRH